MCFGVTVTPARLLSSTGSIPAHPRGDPTSLGALLRGHSTILWLHRVRVPALSSPGIATGVLSLGFEPPTLALTSTKKTTTNKTGKEEGKPPRLLSQASFKMTTLHAPFLLCPA